MQLWASSRLKPPSTAYAGLVSYHFEVLLCAIFDQGLQWHTENTLTLVIVAIGVVPALTGEPCYIVHTCLQCLGYIYVIAGWFRILLLCTVASYFFHKIGKFRIHFLFLHCLSIVYVIIFPTNFLSLCNSSECFPKFHTQNSPSCLCYFSLVSSLGSGTFA